jgi:hypothetical protein
LKLRACPIREIVKGSRPDPLPEGDRSKEEEFMSRWLARIGIGLGFILLLEMIQPHPLPAFSIAKANIFTEGAYTFHLEVRVSGHNLAKKRMPLKMSSLKVKIKNKRASSEILKVRAIRAYLSPNAHQDIETKGYPISPGQWVTKYYRLPEEKRPIIGEQGYIEIVFEHFTVRFNPRDRTFQGPLKK